jgi:hypothetical protein
MTAMRFRSIKAWLVSYLGTHAAAGGYRVAGYKDDAVAADFLSGANRLVQVFVKSGEIPRDASSFNGPVSHDVTVAVELLTAAKASADLSVLESPTATAGQISSALAATQKATEVADADADEFFDAIYQLLMAADQQDLGFEGEVANRWAGRWHKGAPFMRGEYVIVSVTIEFSFRTFEDLTGETPKAPTTGHLIAATIETTTTEDADPEGGAAVTVGG